MVKLPKGTIMIAEQITYKVDRRLPTSAETKKALEIALPHIDKMVVVIEGNADFDLRYGTVLIDKGPMETESGNVHMYGTVCPTDPIGQKSGMGFDQALIEKSCRQASVNDLEFALGKEDAFFTKKE